jgi:hypothetical protein
MGEGFQMALNIISNDPFYWSRKEKMLAGLNSLSLSRDARRLPDLVALVFLRAGGMPACAREKPVAGEG